VLTGIDQSLTSLRSAFDQLDRVAQRVARDGAGGDVAENLVELSKVRAQVRADVAVVRTAEDMLGTLIDTFA
jgi:hypothetical protein